MSELPEWCPEGFDWGVWFYEPIDVRPPKKGETYIKGSTVRMVVDIADFDYPNHVPRIIVEAKQEEPEGEEETGKRPPKKYDVEE